MTELLLKTKLYIPPPRPELVTRPRLLAQLNHGFQMGRKLTLVSAPAGFGKTTLVSEWIASEGLPAGWLSLDEGDNDPVRFLTYLVAAVQTIPFSPAPAGKPGEEVLAALRSPQPPPAESLLIALINEITTLPDHFVLVLDDYHVLESPAVDAALTFLLEHLPPQMHLAITTREDPQLPLARLRARNQLTELRAADLRFSPAEAAGFLNQVMGFDLSEEEINTLETRTEGWIAGLQLAALSMRGRVDVSAFIQAFAGNNRYVVDYLVEEVLQHRPETMRTFLLRTSILDRMSGPLCDAVVFGIGGESTGREQSQLLLEDLERGNLFVVPLDDRRRWFRYHRLFADVLQAHLLAEQPDYVPVLHRRASEWFAGQDMPAEAVRHALAAQDYARAADFIELAWPEMDRSFRVLTWLGWVRALPDEVLDNRPVLCVAYAWALMGRGELEVAVAFLQTAERWLGKNVDEGRPKDTPAGAMLVADQEQFHFLPASIATARAYYAQAAGDVSGTVKYGQRALALLPEEDHLRRGIAAAILGLAYWENGDLDGAYQTMAEGMEKMQLAGNLLFAIRGTYILADIRLAQGRLREAVRIYEQYLQLAEKQGAFVLRGTADLYLRLAELYLEQDRWPAATAHIRRGEELGEQSASLHWQYRLCLAQARVKKSQGDLDGALALLDEAERRYVRTPVPDMHPIAALKAQVWVAQGRLPAALEWAREQGLSVGDALSYRREFEHITLARVLIAQYQTGREEDALQEAFTLLERLYAAAAAGGRMGSVIEILVLQALAYRAAGDIAAALAALENALSLAEPEGYVTLFVDEGQPMAALLREAARREIAPAYARRLQAAFERGAAPAVVSQPLVVPLTGRELEVLRLLKTEMTGPEIARELMVSLNTLRTHTKNIYNKLEVNNRRAAALRAEELELI